jgi:hypothetical protein
MSEPRNVTPGQDQPSDEFHQRYYAERREGPEWAGWTWASRGRNFPWLGVLLVLIGIALLLQYFVPGIEAGTLILIAVGFAFLTGWVLAGSWAAVVPGVLILSLGVAELIEDLALLGQPGEDVPGLASAALAVGFALIWLLGYVRGRPSAWPLWGLAIFGLIGFAQLSGRIAGIPELGALWPILIIAIGILLLFSARNRSAPGS